MKSEAQRGPFEGKVSIVKDTKDRIALRMDDAGKFSIPKDTDKVFGMMQELAEKHGSELVIFAPDGIDNALAKPIVMRNYKSVYMAYLEPRKTGSRVVKLA